MKALVFEAPEQITWSDKPQPQIHEGTDAIVKVEAFTFSRQDLRPYLGQDKTVKAGRIMGHEAVGIVVEIGAHIKHLKVGDRVVINCMSRCGVCHHCQNNRTCSNAGFILGVSHDGTHAEYVRVPFADYSTYVIDPTLDYRTALMLCDVLPTAYELAILPNNLLPTSRVAIIGDGPIAMAVLSFCQLLKIKHVVMFGHHFNKMSRAKNHGLTDFVKTDQPFLYLKKFDFVFECAGAPNGESFELAQELLDNRGVLTSIAVYKQPVTLQLNQLWDQDVTIRTGILKNSQTPAIIDFLKAATLKADWLVTKVYNADQVLEAFHEVLTNREQLKVAVKLN